MVTSLIAFSWFANVEPDVTSAKFRQFVDQYCSDSVQFDHFNGAVFVSKGAKVVWDKGYGLEQGASGNRITSRSQFRIGSISKQFVATAIMQLVQSKNFNLDDPITKFLDGCPSAWSAIKVRHLLDHTSGLVNYTSLPEASGEFLTKPHSHDEVLKIIANHALVSTPGAEFEYNNSGYFILGMLIEKVSGMSLSSYLDAKFFRPLGLSTTFDASGDPKKKGVVASFSVDNGTFKPSEFIAMENLFGIGGIVSTTHDLSKWERALFAGKVVSKETLAQMLKPGIGGFGFGFVVDPIGGQQRFYHDGGISDFSSSIQYMPKSDTLVIALSSRGEDGGIRVAYDIVGWLAGSPATIRGIQPDLLRLPASKSLAIIKDAQQKFPRFDISEEKVRELGNYMIISKNKPQALELFKLNALLYPKSADARYRLGLNYSWAKKYDLARAELRAALAIEPNHADSKKLLESMP